MNFLNFLIVLSFNLYWLHSWGKDRYIKGYSGKISKKLSFLLWLFLIWGLSRLVLGILQLDKLLL